MEIKDLSWNDHTHKRFNNPLLPRSIRGLIIGKSGCGKTTLLLNLLIKPGWLDYDRLQVFGKSLHQPEYRILKKAIEERLPKEQIMNLFDNQDKIIKLDVSPISVIEEISKNLTKHSDVECGFYESTDDVPDPRDLDAIHKNVMIFDDLQLEKQNKCETYYIRGRHNNIDCFYLAQNYFKLPRQTIRENSNFICLFPQDMKNVNHIYNDHVSTDMPIEEFRKLCKTAWERQHGFLVIDLTSKKYDGKYRCGFDLFYMPDSLQSSFNEMLPKSV